MDLTQLLNHDLCACGLATTNKSEDMGSSFDYSLPFPNEQSSSTPVFMKRNEPHYPKSQELFSVSPPLERMNPFPHQNQTINSVRTTELDFELDYTDIASHPKITLQPPLPSISLLLSQETNPSESDSLTLPPIMKLLEFQPQPTPIQEPAPHKTEQRVPHQRNRITHETNRFPLANVKRKNWDEQDMLRAMKMVRTTQMSARAAAEICNVPRSTLWDRLNKLKIAMGEKEKNDK
jgi:hypothetical protein